ncbi:MAG: hypothetical protein UX37_C0030G0001, partial [Microgenomates group bacterium GW2011_GWA2_46_16]
LAVSVIATGNKTVEPAPTSASSRFETKEQASGNLTVIVTPQELAAGKPVTFEIVFDTHSVNLDFDVTKAAELRDEQGNTYGTPAWDGDPPGGHHRKGTLTFPIPTEKATTITLSLKNISGVNERTFLWKL